MSSSLAAACSSAVAASPSSLQRIFRSERDLDVVIYGATGFTGRLIAEYFARRTRRHLSDPSDSDGGGGSGSGSGGGPGGRLLRSDHRRNFHRTVRWAIAGRTESKLRSVRSDLLRLPGVVRAGDVGVPSGSGLPSSDCAAYPEVIVAPDGPSMSRMASRASVVISAAGPYLSSPHGLDLVGACVEWGTDYVDITGETPFVRRSMDLYHERARQTGSYVVHMCGFDSIPSDLGTWHAVREWRNICASVSGPDTVRAYVAMRGKLSGGTLASGIEMDDDPVYKAQVRDPYLLGGDIPPGGGPADVTDAEPFADGIAWTAPFEMAKLNTRVVRRSASELKYHHRHHIERPTPENVSRCSSSSSSSSCSQGHSLHGHFSYTERMLVPDEKTARKLARPPAPASKRRELRDAGRLPKPGEGPSEEERRRGWFRFVFVAEGCVDGDDADDSDGLAAGSDSGRDRQRHCRQRRIVTSVTGKGDPGYDETAKMASEAALVLAMAEDRCGTVASLAGVGGGVLTPAWLGEPLLRRLEESGIEFRVEESDDSGWDSGGGGGEGEGDAAVVRAMVRRDGISSKL